MCSVKGFAGFIQSDTATPCTVYRISTPLAAGAITSAADRLPRKMFTRSPTESAAAAV